MVINLSDSLSEVSASSSTTEEDFAYPITPEPLPTISPPTAQLANIRTVDAPMRSPSPPPAQHTYVLPPATNEDPEVNFLINLLHIRITDIIQSYKEGRCPAIHIVESAPAPPYDPFNADPNNIYADELLQDTPQVPVISQDQSPAVAQPPSPIIAQPQPRTPMSLPPVETLPTHAETINPSVLSSPPTRTPSHSPNRPPSPVIHLKHDSVGWNWTHPPTEGDEPSSIVPYDTGHSLLEMEWPKVVLLDDNAFWNHVDTHEVEEPPRTPSEAYRVRDVSRAIRQLRPNLEFLAKRAIGMRALPMCAVCIRDQIPEPIFKQVFSHYATYADLESDLAEKLADGI